MPTPQAEEGIERHKDLYTPLNRHFSQIFDRFWLHFHDVMISILAAEVARTEPGDGGLAKQFDRKMVLAIVVVVEVGLR